MTEGGKARGIARLDKAGVLVPDGFVIPADTVPETGDLADKLAELIARSGCTALAVRSSGVQEDSEAHSLAGLFESVLDVAPELEALLAAIGQCRGSGRSARAQEAGAIEECPAVLVQEMIRPLWSGVLFTRDPHDGSPTPLVELRRGHLAAIVDGAEPELRASLDEAGREALEACVGAQALAALESLVVAVEEVVGGPADVEWALAERGVVALQARAIASLAGPERGSGVRLVPVTAEHAARLPLLVQKHDKVTLRLLAEAYSIPISEGFVMLCEGLDDPPGLEAAAGRIAGWGEFIAVALHPFRWQGRIVRSFGEGPAALECLRQVTGAIDGHREWSAFLLKELQPTARTGVAVLVADESRDELVVDIIHGHFATKGIAGATSYRLGPGGSLRSKREGVQATMAVVESGKTRAVPVVGPAKLTAQEMVMLDRVVRCLAEDHPGAGIEFGFTPSGEFFLVDLYEGEGVVPRSLRDDVICEGRITGRVRVITIDESTVEESIERHVHDAAEAEGCGLDEPTIIVAPRPFHVLDRLVYGAKPGSLGMVFDEGALLCHLAVVMRERGVPGLILPGVTESFAEGDRVTLDARPRIEPTLRRA